MHRYYCFQALHRDTSYMRARSEQASFLPRFVPSYRLSWLPARCSGTKFPAKEMDLRWILPQLFPSFRSPRAKNSFASKSPNNVGTHEHRDIRPPLDFHLSVIRTRERTKIGIIIGPFINNDYRDANPTRTGGARRARRCFPREDMDQWLNAAISRAPLRLSLLFVMRRNESGVSFVMLKILRIDGERISSDTRAPTRDACDVCLCILLTEYQMVLQWLSQSDRWFSKV